MITDIFSYPLKSFSPRPHSGFQAMSGQGVPGDREFAIVHGESKFDFAQPDWQQKQNFLNLRKNPLLASLRTEYNAPYLIFRDSSGEALRLNTESDSPEEDKKLDDFIRLRCSPARPGPYRLARLKGKSFSDQPSELVSIMNELSLEVLTGEVGIQLEKQRMRGNIWYRGSKPWEENEWVGKTITCGEARLKIVDIVGRCPAIDVNPSTGIKDIPLLKILRQRTGQIDFGVFAEITNPGKIQSGQQIKL